MASSLLVDAHVHIHAVFDRSRFLNAAARNVRRAALASGLSGDTPGCLLLTESAGTDVFPALAGGGVDGWSFTVDGPGCLDARHPSGARLLIAAGRQIAARDGLEVLALFTTASFPQGLALDEAIGAVQTAGALPVIPWGFGKWMLRRRRLVEAAIRTAPRPLFLGDNGGRPRGTPPPRLLREGAAAGLPVLPGSDPFPFPAHEGRAASYGFIAFVDPEPPGATLRLKRWLLSLTAQPPVFGERAGLLTFVRDQLRMNLRRRRT
jgi:hypothetical protein